jgi:hypothetical protein
MNALARVGRRMHFRWVMNLPFTALARGMDIDDAVAFGVAAGSAAVMRPGHDLCIQEDAERLYQQMQRSMAVPVAI